MDPQLIILIIFISGVIVLSSPVTEYIDKNKYLKPFFDFFIKFICYIIGIPYIIVLVLVLIVGIIGLPFVLIPKIGKGIYTLLFDFPPIASIIIIVLIVAVFQNHFGRKN